MVNVVEITAHLSNDHSARETACRITLKQEGRFRGFMIDNHAFGIRRKGTSTQLFRLNEPLDKAAKLGEGAFGDVLLEVENPLEQTIISALKGEPVTGLQRTYESQLFLERLHGHRPS